ncbi:MAG: aminopeptidase P family protein [Deltaproteobacteria bacterium]|nr:aminopeptidase P family protein [Deltaproteobacteria bacterium]
MDHTARLIVDSPNHDPDLFYACHFSAGDPVIFLEHRRRKYLLLSDLELDRARQEATVDEVLSISTVVEAKNGVRRAARRLGGRAGIVQVFCHAHRIKRLLVPETMSVGVVDALRTVGLRIDVAALPFYPQRFFKTPGELRAMKIAQRATFAAMSLAEQMLRDSIIDRNQLVWQGKPLTSERMRAELSTFLSHQGFSCPEGMIIACGPHTIEPHNHGSGPLRPHQAIIVDIYPRSLTTRFFGDATRTFCRGTAPDALKQLYSTVKTAQVAALRQVRAGVNGQRVHGDIVKRFEAAGYATKEMNGRRQGFIHGTGHGLGYAVHEEPLRINRLPCRLRTGHVVTVEPGLYYEGIGGVRIEDVVVVTPSGADLLARYPKRLEIL